MARKPYKSDRVEILEAATLLVDVGDGRITRSIIDAVRDAYFSRYGEGRDDCWRDLMTVLDEVAGGSGYDSGFQAFDHEMGRTHGDRISLVEKAIAAMPNYLTAKRDEEYRRQGQYSD